MKPEADSNEVELTINRHYNKKELCFLFGDLTLYYLNRMIENTPDVGEPLGIGFSPKQVMVLINQYGLHRTFLKNQAKIH